MIKFLNGVYDLEKNYFNDDVINLDYEYGYDPKIYKQKKDLILNYLKYILINKNDLDYLLKILSITLCNTRNSNNSNNCIKWYQYGRSFYNINQKYF